MGMENLDKIARKLEKDGEPTLFPRAAYAAQVEEENAEKRGPTSIGDLMAKRLPQKKGRATERGELLKYFNERITNKKGKRFGIPFIAMKCQGMSVQDLYHLKSVCDQESKRTFTDEKTGKAVQITFGMVFWQELRPKAT